MKKINALLHDVTVINFHLLGKLTLRYRIVTMLAFIVFALSSAFIYYSQVTVYAKKVTLKIYAPEEGGNEKKKLIDVVSEGVNSFLNQNEVISIIYGHDFTKSLSEKLVKSIQFSKMDFNSISNRSPLSHAEIFAKCHDEKCFVTTLQGILPSLYKVDTDQVTGKFILSVTSRSEILTLEIVNNFKTVLEEQRLNTKLADYDYQIEQTTELIRTIRDEIDSKGGFVRFASGASIDAEISNQNDKIKGIVSRLNKQLDDYQFQQIRLRQSGVTANQTINSSQKLEYESVDKIMAKVDSLRQNIAAMNLMEKSSRTKADERVLKELKAELAKSELELNKSDPLSRNISSDDKFITTQIKNQASFSFDFKVTSEKVQKLQREYAAAKKELDDLITKKVTTENGLLALKPDLEYLKLMESKLVSLRMLRTTLKSDVVFDHFGLEVASFKRNSLAQILGFSFFITIFFLFSALIMIYLVDDKIREPSEVLSCFEDLPVIGKAPDFD